MAPNLFTNALELGLAHGFAVLGVLLAFRVLRFPDLTADGSFLIGGATFTALLGRGFSWPTSVAAAVAAGALTGGATATLHLAVGVHRLLAGILTTMIAYSIGFRLLGSRSIQQVPDTAGLPPGLSLLGFFAIIAVMLFHRFLTSDAGLLFRAVGQQEELVRDLGRRPERYLIVGLMAANGLVAFAACLVTNDRGFAGLDMGVGVVILLVASMVLGEHVMHRPRWLAARPLLAMSLVSFCGCIIYYLFYLTILRASIRGWLHFSIDPTDLKALSALLVALFIGLRARRVRPDPSDALPI